MVPGGSSGGSAAAVAMGEAILSIGSDTAGSIRQPAAFCGVVGVKPTYGRVSRYGLIAFASSIDCVGPITKDVRDSAIMMNIMVGHDPRDSTSAFGKKVEVPDYTQFLGQSIKGLRVGIPREYFDPELLGVHEEVLATVEEAKKVLKDAGAILVEVSMPHTKHTIPCYFVISRAEASSNLHRYDGVKYGHRTKKTY